MDLISFLTSLIAVLGFLLGIAYFYQVAYMFVPYFIKDKPHKPTSPHRYAVLIAARNEESVLPHLLESIHQQDYPQDQISVFVVADNCTDRTAQVARAAGATVFVRENHKQVGKGYALHYLLEQIRTQEGWDRFDAFLVFDADNLLSPDYVTQINRMCSDGYPVFCGYRNIKNFGDSWVSAGQGVQYIHESAHFNHSRTLLGLNGIVSGTGFGFTRELIERLDGWNFFMLTEDTEFSVWCITHGVSIGYCNTAVLYDEQPITLRQSWRQRTRWAQGVIQISLHYGLDLFRGVLRGGRMGFSSFGSLTRSTWFMSIAGVTFVLSLVLALLAGGWLGLARFLLISLGSVYGCLLGPGAFTVLAEWKRIRSSTGKKIASIFTYPLYVITSLPITATAAFRKFGWPPIEHTAAISTSDLNHT